MATVQNRVFFPQSALDQWLTSGKVDLRGNELMINEEQRRYEIVEAVLVVREVSGAPDAFNLVGRVKPKDKLEREGAEIFDTSLVYGENAYDVVPGWLGLPVGRSPRPTTPGTCRRTSVRSSWATSRRRSPR